MRAPGLAAVAVLVVLVALAIPALLGSRKSRQEAAAVQAIHSIHSAQVMASRKKGRFLDLAGLGEAGLIDAELGLEPGALQCRRHQCHGDEPRFHPLPASLSSSRGPSPSASGV